MLGICQWDSQKKIICEMQSALKHFVRLLGILSVEYDNLKLHGLILNTHILPQCRFLVDIRPA